MTGTTVSIVSDAERFRSLEPEWRDLLGDSESDNLFLTWDWLHTWWRHCPDDRELFIATLRRHDRLIAIAPFVTRRRRLPRLQPLSTVQFLGTGNIGSDYLDLIVRRGEAAAAIAPP